MRMKRFILFTGALLWCFAGMVTTAGAEQLSDNALSRVSAKGDVSAGGSLSTACTPSSTSICTGLFSWTDSHANDSSQYKGAIHQTGYVQQNLSANINVNATESAIATGANVVSNVTAATGATVTLSNTQSAVGYIGGF